MRALRAVAGLALLLASGAAMALGLGEIRVKSQPGQPLLAEIPIISSEPGELEQLQARLASPTTFDRVGLPRPEGLVSGLNFAVALSEDGRPVIRVTSVAPVQVAVVNFLIEVDWGQGRLVREYSALVNAPGALASASQPVIQAPQPPPSSFIVREPEPLAAAPIAQAEPLPAIPEPSPAPAPTPAPAAQPRPPVAVVQPAPAAVPASAADEILVQRGQTLSRIARDLDSGYSLDQSMLALLRANPDAFINGNINLLKQGAVLRVPATQELAQLGEAEAAVLVRDQMADWRRARRPVPQPVDAGTTAATVAAVTRARTPGTRVAEARLEIAPPVADAATQAGTQSGINAEGEGDMLATQQLTQTREELAARESEVQELRAQVAELEGLQQQQAKLIALKDSDLAAAQQRMAQSQGDAAQPVWLWAGLGLLVAGLVVAWLIGRRRAIPAAPRRAYDSAALAAVIPAAPGGDAAAGESELRDARIDEDSEVPATLPDDDTTRIAEPEPRFEREPDPGIQLPPAAQAWTSAAVKPTWHTPDLGAGVAPLNSAPAGRERLELAVAYLDLGDVKTARDLLNEVIAGGDPSARDEAAQLLRELG
ncbi:MAG: ferrous iron transporter B [Pseudoxanthomonas sp.]|nr:ferrous iron transporter B [Pseudoxanthomonas sp.]